MSKDSSAVNEEPSAVQKEPSAVQKMIGDFAPKLAELTDEVLFGDGYGCKEVFAKG
ncbi:MAG: hypothetical protein WBX38_15405 [Candidatus Sulfotelmatobacter sp.]